MSPFGCTPTDPTRTHRGATGTGDSAGGVTGPGACAPGACAPGARCACVPASRPAARHCRCPRSVWTRTRRRWSPGGRGLTGRGGSSSAPCPTCRRPAPPPPPSPTTSLSTGATGLVRVSDRHYYLIERHHGYKTETEGLSLQTYNIKTMQTESGTKLLEAMLTHTNT